MKSPKGHEVNLLLNTEISMQLKMLKFILCSVAAVQNVKQASGWVF